jgi:hypothetical protein
MEIYKIKYLNNNIIKKGGALPDIYSKFVNKNKGNYNFLPIDQYLNKLSDYNITICKSQLCKDTDIFNKIVQLRDDNPNNNIYIIVPGNAGLPGGKHGTARDKFNINDDTTIVLRDINKKHSPLEEQIMEKWLREVDDNDIIYRDSIGKKWGLYNNSTYDTIQGINYTIENKDATKKYGKCFNVDNISLNINDSTINNINLLFTFAPNYNKTFPSGEKTKEPVTDINYKRDALTACIKECLTSVLSNSIVIIPHLGAGVNQCYISNLQDTINLKKIKVSDSSEGYKYVYEDNPPNNLESIKIMELENIIEYINICVKLSLEMKLKEKNITIYLFVNLLKFIDI